MRSGAENASFALSGATLGGNPVTVTPYFNMSDPQFFSNPVYLPVLVLWYPSQSSALPPSPCLTITWAQGLALCSKPWAPLWVVLGPPSL